MSGSSSSDELVFDGHNGLAAGAYVRMIRQLALAKDKQDNDRWLAQTAAAYLDGPALRWFEDLDEDTQDSWKLLRRAILARWPPDQPISPFSPFSRSPLSDPLSIGPLTNAELYPGSSFSPIQIPNALPLGPISGRIRVLLSGGDVPIGYLSKITDSDGDLEACQNLSDAVTVQITPSSLPHGIKMTSYVAQEEWLGMNWDGGDTLEETETKLATRTPCVAFLRAVYNPAGTDGRVAESIVPSVHLGVARAVVWNVLIDGSVVASWETGYSARYPLRFEVATIPKGNYKFCIAVTNSITPLANVMPYMQERGYKRARLVFEPM